MEFCFSNKVIFPWFKVNTLPGGSEVKNPLPVQKTWVPSLGQKTSGREKMATHFNILTKKSHGQRVVGCSPWDCRIGRDWVTQYWQQSDRTASSVLSPVMKEIIYSNILWTLLSLKVKFKETDTETNIKCLCSLVSHCDQKPGCWLQSDYTSVSHWALDQLHLGSEEQKHLFPGQSSPTIRHTIEKSV